MNAENHGSNERKRALFVTTRLFWPADSGRKVSLFNYCRGLHDQLGYDVYLYSFMEGDQKPSMVNDSPSFIEHVELADDISTSNKILNLIRAVFDRDMPLQCCMYLDDNNMKRLGDYIDAVCPQVVVFDMVRLAPYMSAAKSYPVVLNFDDLLSKRYERQLARPGSNILGKYESKSSIFTKMALHLSLFRNLILKSESLRVGRAELKYGAAADSCLFVSPIEAKALDRSLRTNKCFVASLGAESKAVERSKSDIKFDFGFVGNMFTSANQDSLNYIVNNLLPLMPGASLRVIGVCPEGFSNQYSDNHDLSFSGRVESIEDELKKCHLTLAPFAYGTGIKTKVIESMGLGIPVVTNSIGAEGLSAVPGRDFIVEDDPAKLVSQAKKLLGDDVLCDEMSASGVRYVGRFHNWDLIFSDLNKCIKFARLQHLSQ